MYTKEVMDHFSNPHNVGEIENPDGVGEVGNPKCGDMMKITIKVGHRPTSTKYKAIQQNRPDPPAGGERISQQCHPELAEGSFDSVSNTESHGKIINNKTEEYIEDVRFLTLGCAAAIASSSMMTDLALGKTLDEALEITKDDINDSLGKLPAQKYHCSILSAEGIHKAIEDYRNKRK